MHTNRQLNASHIETGAVIFTSWIKRSFVEITTLSTLSLSAAIISSPKLLSHATFTILRGRTIVALRLIITESHADANVLVKHAVILFNAHTRLYVRGCGTSPTQLLFFFPGNGKYRIRETDDKFGLALA